MGLIEALDNRIEAFRAKMGEKPKYLVLPEAIRSALIRAHVGSIPGDDVITYKNIPIINLEETLVVV